MAPRSSRLGAVLFFLAATACGTSSSLVTSSDSALQTTTDDGGAPPQPAVDACADLTLDDDCSFTGARGETLSGTCQDVPGGELACVPAGGRGDCGSGGPSGPSGPGGGEDEDGGARRGPPPEAVDACASAAEDDACTFSHGSHSVTGTCKYGPDHDTTRPLACAPARPPQA
jgi:hypothetical protein